MVLKARLMGGERRLQSLRVAVQDGLHLGQTEPQSPQGDHVCRSGHRIRPIRAPAGFRSSG